MIRLNPRTGPPSRMTAAQSTVISAVVAAQSLNTGRGCANPTVLRGAPPPACAWRNRLRGTALSRIALALLWRAACIGAGAPTAPLAPTRNATTGTATARRPAATRFGKELMVTTKWVRTRSVATGNSDPTDSEVGPLSYYGRTFSVRWSLRDELPRTGTRC